MKLNFVSPGLMLIGTSVKKLIIDNDIVEIERDASRSFGLNIHEPSFQRDEEGLYAQMIVEMEIVIQQSEDQMCKIQFSLEGAFSAEGEDEERFQELVVVNGAASLIGIARGKMEAISGTIFNIGKIVIPFVNVLDYYRGNEEKSE